MLTVNEVSKLTGVTVRALRFYDDKGILNPARRTEKGYRLYGAEQLKKLQTILLLRELDFSIDEIAGIMRTPSFDAEAVLDSHIKLLEMKRDRIERLIAHALELKKKGVNAMDFSSFDTKEIDKYREEAKRRWQGTEAWIEYERNREGRSPKQTIEAGERLMDVFREFGELRADGSPESSKAEKLVMKLRTVITEEYYNCTPCILSGLGRMYAEDERMRRCIDEAAGEGTALFASRAIAAYCARSET
jgi:DNA-binding transcriptional MerR regulator